MTLCLGTSHMTCLHDGAQPFLQDVVIGTYLHYGRTKKDLQAHYAGLPVHKRLHFLRESTQTASAVCDAHGISVGMRECYLPSSIAKNIRDMCQSFE